MLVVMLCCYNASAYIQKSCFSVVVSSYIWIYRKIPGGKRMLMNICKKLCIYVETQALHIINMLSIGLVIGLLIFNQPH